jgi:hypothetical protein
MGMISEDTKWFLFAMLVFFSLPICISIILINGEVIPVLAKEGFSLNIVILTFHMIVVSTVIGILIEFFAVKLYELFISN